MYRRQYSFELEIEEKSRNDPEAGMQLRRRHPTISGRPSSLKRQISEAPDPDEMGEIIWGASDLEGDRIGGTVTIAFELLRYLKEHPELLLHRDER